MAVQANNLDLARRALEENKMQQKMNEYKASYEQNKVADNLRLKLEEMRKQLNELKINVRARVNAAKAQKNINQAMSGFDSNSAKAGLSRMEEKDSSAEASGEVYKKEKSLDDEFASLNKNSAVDDELARIMKQYEK